MKDKLLLGWKCSNGPDAELIKAAVRIPLFYHHPHPMLEEETVLLSECPAKEAFTNKWKMSQSISLLQEYCVSVLPQILFVTLF